VPHRDAVIYGDGVKLGSETATRFDGSFDALADGVKVRVAGDKLGERIDDGDERFAHLGVFHSVGTPESTGTRHAAALSGDGASQLDFHGLQKKEKGGLGGLGRRRF
jgi:hypothetical protein